MVPLNRATVTRIVAFLTLVALAVLDFLFHGDIVAFLGTHHLGTIILCAIVAVGLALALTSLITGAVSFEDANLRWLALLFFVILLLRYSLVSIFELTPSVLLFIGIVVCILGLCRRSKLDTPAAIRTRDLSLTMRVLTIGLIFGLYLVLAATGYAPKEQDRFSVERTAMGWGLAYFGASFIVGFLFAYPRTLQGDADKGTTYEQRVNTNLEQISDWLTKIIVGLGLIELKQMPLKLAEAAAWMAQSFAPAGTAPNALSSFCTAFIVYFSVLGFLAGHLSTRMFLAEAFFRGDPRKVVEVERKTAIEGPGVTSYLEFVKDPANTAKVDAWLTLKGYQSLKASDIATGTEYATLRKQALDELDKS
jgi:hypothetical protein